MANPVKVCQCPRQHCGGWKAGLGKAESRKQKAEIEQIKSSRKKSRNSESSHKKSRNSESRKLKSPDKS